LPSTTSACQKKQKKLYDPDNLSSISMFKDNVFKMKGTKLDAILRSLDTLHRLRIYSKKLFDVLDFSLCSGSVLSALFPYDFTLLTIPLLYRSSSAWIRYFQQRTGVSQKLKTIEEEKLDEHIVDANIID